MSSYYDEDKFVERYTERFSLKVDKDWSYREARLYILQKFLNGTIYDNLQPFYQEYSDGTDNGKYVPLSRRRPSVIYKLPKIIVDASVGMLFGEGHFPTPSCGDNGHENTTQFLQYITRVCDLKGTMLDAARKGSIGSVAVLIKVLEGKFFFEALHTIHLTPIFKRTNPRELEKLVEKKKIDGDTLRVHGYTIPDEDSKESFFVMREWTENEEIYYQPYKVDKDKNPNFSPTKDDDRSVQHDLGFVPICWIKNLPKTGGFDGHGTFEDILDICIEIDYQWSQHGRLLKYSSDPTLVVKNSDSLQGQELVKGLTTLNLDEKGDAYYVEITTGATKSVMEYTKGLRDMALEIVRGNRSNPDKVHSAQSGEALKMLNFELVSLVEEMRITYGEHGLLCIYGMILKMVASNNIAFKFDENIQKPDSTCENHILLDWPAWYPPSAMDKFQEAQTLGILLDNEIICHDTATKTVADEYNILDISQERKDIDAKQDEMYDKETSLKNINKNSVAPKTAKVAPKQ